MKSELDCRVWTFLFFYLVKSFINVLWKVWSLRTIRIGLKLESIRPCKVHFSLERISLTFLWTIVGWIRLHSKHRITACWKIRERILLYPRRSGFKNTGRRRHLGSFWELDMSRRWFVKSSYWWWKSTHSFWSLCGWFRCRRRVLGLFWRYLFRFRYFFGSSSLVN